MAVISTVHAKSDIRRILKHTDHIFCPFVNYSVNGLKGIVKGSQPEKTFRAVCCSQLANFIKRFPS